VSGFRREGVGVQSTDGAMGAVVAWVRDAPGTAILLWAIIQGIIGAFAISGWLRAAKIARRQSRMLRGVSGDALEPLLLEYVEDKLAVRRDLDHALRVGETNTVAISKGLRKVGLVRYDAFENIGGRQSFSMALLDETANGIVLTSLVSRQDIRVYAKPILAGATDGRLSDEEAAAIAQARTAADRDGTG